MLNRLLTKLQEQGLRAKKSKDFFVYPKFTLVNEGEYNAVIEVSKEV